jgi:hypothetical protein
MKRFLSLRLAVFTAFVLAATPALSATILRSTVAVVPLVQKDSSDCLNSDVTSQDTKLGGFVTITQLDDKSFTANVVITSGTKNTQYNFYLKCFRLLGSITTNEYGIGYANILLGGSTLAGRSYAFDMYPGGAPPGNKYQSLQFQL